MIRRNSVPCQTTLHQFHRASRTEKLGDRKWNNQHWEKDKTSIIDTVVITVHGKWWKWIELTCLSESIVARKELWKLEPSCSLKEGHKVYFHSSPLEQRKQMFWRMYDLFRLHPIGCCSLIMFINAIGTARLQGSSAIYIKTPCVHVRTQGKEAKKWFKSLGPYYRYEREFLAPDFSLTQS